MKTIIAIIIFLAVACVYLNYRIDVLKGQNARLESEKNGLKMQVETNGRTINVYNKKILDASKQIAELKETALKVDDSCYSQRISPVLLGKLRKSRSNADTTGKDNK